MFALDESTFARLSVFEFNAVRNDVPEKFHLLVDASGLLKTATVTADSLEEACEKAEAKGLKVVSSDQRDPPKGLLTFASVVCVLAAALSVLAPLVTFLTIEVSGEWQLPLIAAGALGAGLFVTLFALVVAALHLVQR